MAQHEKLTFGPQGPVYNHTLAIYEKCNYVLQLLPLVSLGLSKTSVLFFYRRIFKVHPRFKIINQLLIILVIAWAVSFFFATAFQCDDPKTLWTTFEYARTNCIDTLPFYYSVSITGFITDLMILSSPIPIIWRLKTPLKNKIAVAGILLLGAVVCGAGIARFVTFINIGRGIYTHINDITYFTTPVFAWTMIESSLAVVSANLPLLRPLLQKTTYTESSIWSLLRTAGGSHSPRKGGSRASFPPQTPPRPRRESPVGSGGFGGYGKESWEFRQHSVEVEKVQEPVGPLDGKIHVQRGYGVV
ncbi:MAG: hypothetical protein Q9227_000091 [Pyrenula ochraceoflavens]